ncbi:MAG: ABC transporter substrate-binding protein, partial [Bacteroidota bacterium]
MMNLKGLMSGLLILATLCVPALEAADLQAKQTVDSEESEIRELLGERDREIKSVIDGDEEVSDAQREELEEIVNEMVDYHSMARYALGETWAELDSETRAEFTRLFSTIVRDQSMNNMEIYRAEISYGEIDVDGEEAHVETEASLEKVTTGVHYTLKRTDGSWMI